jgi:hypothetical protein
MFRLSWSELACRYLFLIYSSNDRNSICFHLSPYVSLSSLEGRDNNEVGINKLRRRMISARTSQEKQVELEVGD